MALLEESIRIPEKRLAVVIGKNGETKQKISQKTKTKLFIDSAESTIEVKTNATNTTGFYTALDIIKAIGRGFSPEHAFLLLKPDYVLEVITVSDWVQGSEKELQNKRGRIIGKQGKARTEIEQKTGCAIAVQGKTVGIIGLMEDIPKAKKAIEMLLRGSTHEKAYRYLNQTGMEEEFDF